MPRLLHDPRAIYRFQSGETIAQVIGRAGWDLGKPRIRARVEGAVLALLEEATNDD
jgi:hypothetical protein